MRLPKGKSSTRINKVLNNRVVGILNGRVGASNRRTLLCALGISFRTITEFWMNLQKLNELRLAEKKSRQIIKTLPMLANRKKTKSL